MIGLNLVWRTIGEFFSCLPVEVVYVATFCFAGFLIIGLLGWIK